MKTKLNNNIKEYLDNTIKNWNEKELIEVIDTWALSIKELKEYNKIIDEKEKQKREAKKRKKKINNKFKMKKFFRLITNN